MDATLVLITGEWLLALPPPSPGRRLVLALACSSTLSCRKDSLKTSISSSTADGCD